MGGGRTGEESMKLIRRQRIWLALIIVINLALWFVPSDVVEQIARDRHTMLGRYSRTHFGWIVVVAGLSLVSFYIDWSTGLTYKRRWFQVMAILLFLAPVVGVADFLLRAPQRVHYVRDSVAYHRPPHFTHSGVFEDKPRARRTYPDLPPSYGSVSCTLTTDKRGFRNQAARDRCDVVVLGDSFAEGSKVSDEHAWPVRLAAVSGLSVYNLGMSGYSPLHYLESLRRYGLALKPRYVLCMLYEGNDFRSASSDGNRGGGSFSKRIKTYFKQSPMVSAVDDLLIETFGPINCYGRVKGVDVLDWLPLAIPEGPGAKHYTFAPKQLRDLYESREQFARGDYWRHARAKLEDMNRLCAQAGCQLVVVFAPTKAHVTLLPLGDQLPADKVLAFTAMSYKGDLPAPDTFLANLLRRVDAKESVVKTWCGGELIPFTTTTDALRGAAMAGTQVYYTHDQHWTPEGHGIVASAVHRFLVDGLLSEPADSTTP